MMLSTIMTALGTKVAAAAVAAAMLAGGAAGASAAVGGPDVADSVHDVLREAGVPVPGGDDEVTDADVDDTDGDAEDADVDGEDGDGDEPRCREATQHALEVLNALLEDGRPVENAIEAIENCGNDDADDDDGDDEDRDEPRCREATQHALERLNELLADGRPVENAIEAIENCGNGDDDGDGDGEADTEDADGEPNPNSEEKSDNKDDGINNSGDHAENGKSHANPRAFEGAGGD